MMRSRWAALVLVLTGLVQVTATALDHDGGPAPSDAGFTDGGPAHGAKHGHPDAGQVNPDGGIPVHAGATVAAPPKPPPPKLPPPKAQTEEEKALSLLHKKQFDMACPLLEKLARAAPDNATLWAEWGQCEAHRPSHRKSAIEAASRAAMLGDRPVRETNRCGDAATTGILRT
jgi:hypothetical protein